MLVWANGVIVFGTLNDAVVVWYTLFAHCHRRFSIRSARAMPALQWICVASLTLMLSSIFVARNELSKFN